jgi:hypothetical protein
MTKLSTRLDARSAPPLLDRRAVAGRLRRMGISIASLPAGDLDEVRVWAATLTEIEIEYVAETSRAIRAEAEDEG